MRIRRVLVALVACLTAGCASVPGPPPSESPAGPGAAVTTAAPLTSPDRPDVPIPDVQVPGITAPPPGSGIERYREQQVTWGRCPEGPARFACAEVLAPLDWSDPDGDALTLFLLKVPATAQPRLGTIFVNPGGPGEPGSPLAGSFARKGLEQYDIVGWDPRGTGRSTPVVCAPSSELDRYFGVDVSPDDDTEREAAIASNTWFGEACLSRSGRLLQHISTMDTVTDLELLRELLGEDTLNYFGYSYGTDIGSRYAHIYPDRVGRMALDGAVNVTASDEVVQAVGFDRALATFAEWCVVEHCSLGGDAEQVMNAVTDVLDELDTRPLVVQDRLLTQAYATTGVLMALYGAELEWGMLAEALRGVRGGDGGLMLLLADIYNDRGPTGDYSARLTAFSAIRCLDEADDGIAGAERDAEAQSDKAPVLGPYFGPDYVCPTWPVRPVPEPEPVVAAGAPPILVIGSTGDSATPYEFARGMADQLESGVLLTYDGPGHGSYGGRSACVDDVVVRYFTTDVPPVAQTCG